MPGSITDQAYSDVGATIVDRAMDVISNCDMILKVRAPAENELSAYRAGQVVVGMLNPLTMLPWKP